MLDSAVKARTPEELKKIESIASAALGIDSKRGDTIVLESIPFQAPVPEPGSKTTIVQKFTRIAHDWTGALRVVGILALFLVVYMLVLRPVKKQVLATVRQLTAQKAEGAKVTAERKLDGDDASGKANIRKELAERVKAEPEVASRLLQSWIRKSEEARP
jgi:flagellar M-ring protein FliF